MSDDDDPKPKARWPWFLAGGITVIFVIVVLVIIYIPYPDVETDDAYVAAHFAVVAPRIAGQVSTVRVNDNQRVAPGQLLVTLDDRDQQATLDRALAMLAADRARLAQTGAEVARQPALIAQAQARIAAAQARLALAQANARRYRNLAATGAGTQQDRQQATATLAEDQADANAAAAQLQAAQLQLATLRATRQAAAAGLGVDAAAVRQARLDLGYTRIAAPIGGSVDQRTVQVGDIVAPGAGLLILMPLGRAYIEANYRELALRHMMPGQHARIHVDAYNIWLNGTVQSLPPSSGEALSPIPPNNATGNFTKIVQRLPVKIVIDPGQRLAALLRVGMSCETIVHTHLRNVVAAQRQTNADLTGYQ